MFYNPFTRFALVTTMALSVGLLTTAEAQFQKVPPARINKKKTVTQADILENKLKNMVVPRVNFEQVSLDEAVDFLRKQSVKLDTSKEKTGANFVLRLPKYKSTEKAPPTPVIRELKLQNIPMLDLLKLITDNTGMTYKIENYAVIISPRG